MSTEPPKGMPASMHQSWMQFRAEQAAKAAQSPIVTEEPEYCTRAEMDEVKRELAALKAVIPPYSVPTMIDFRCRPMDDEIANLKDDLANVTRALGRYAISECGEVPENHLLTYLKCQVWHSPWLTKDEQKIKSIWSLRLSVEVAHHRLPEEINIRLFPLKQFYKTATKPANRTDSVISACDFLMDHGATGDAWAGFIQGFTRKKGRPYVKDQAAFLVHAGRDITPTATQARLSFMLAGKLHRFSDMRPANGDAGSALWWCEWRASESSRSEPAA